MTPRIASHRWDGLTRSLPAQNSTTNARANTPASMVAGTVLCSGPLLAAVTGINAAATAEIRLTAKMKATAQATAATAVLSCLPSVAASTSAASAALPTIMRPGERGVGSVPAGAACGIRGDGAAAPVRLSAGAFVVIVRCGGTGGTRLMGSGPVEVLSAPRNRAAGRAAEVRLRLTGRSLGG